MKKSLPANEMCLLNKKNKRLIDPDEAKLFFKLQEIVERFIVDNSNILSDIKKEGKPIAISELRQRIHDHLFDNRTLLDRLVAQKDAILSEDEKQIILGWKRAIYGKILCIKYYAGYAVMCSFDDPKNFYGVLGLTQDFDDVIPMDPPLVIKTALLPFKGRIVWSGLCASYGLMFGSNIRATLFNDCIKAREKDAIQMSL